MFLPVMSSFELQHGPLGGDVLRAEDDHRAPATLDVGHDLVGDCLANFKVAHVDTATVEK